MVFPHSVKKFNCGEQFLLLTYSEIQKIIPHNDLKNIISYMRIYGILPDILIPLLHLVRSFELQNNYRSDKLIIILKRNSKRSNLTQELNQIFNS